FNMYPVRFLEAFAFARVLLRRELIWSHLNRLDWTLLLLYNYSALVAIARSHAGAFQVAAATDPTLCYLAIRGLIGSLEDVRHLLLGVVALLVPFTGLVLVERLTGSSAFTLVGAAPELLFRNGIARCQGSFRHAILLGSVAASFLALYVALWFGGVRRVVSALGASLCLLLIVLSNSGGPVTSTAAVFIGWAAWPVRTRLRTVRWTALALLLLVVVAMKAPIWYLPYKISSIVGGGGYHRGLLMERAWQDLGRWWLVGIDSKDTSGWLPYVLEAVGGVDLTNQFLVFALNGGLAALALCIGVLVAAFKGLGGALKLVRDAPAQDRAQAFLIWGLGVTIFVHAVSWLGVSYFDQSWVIWLTHAAAVSVAIQTVALGAQQHAAPAGATVPNGRPTVDRSIWNDRRRGPHAANRPVIVRRRFALSDDRAGRNR